MMHPHIAEASTSAWSMEHAEMGRAGHVRSEEPSLLASPSLQRTTTRGQRRQAKSAVRSACDETHSRRTMASGRATSSAHTMLTAVTLACLVALAALLPSTAAQRTVRQQGDDPITIVGTWATGSAQVQTGLQFFNPLNQTFNVPKVGGQSYSFTADGFWEQSLFTFTSDPGKPNCAQAQLIWQHGNFTMNNNGSLTLRPFVGDGRQMIQNGCSEVSSQVQSYDQQEYMEGFYIRREWHYGKGAYYLQMFEFDGTPKPWMWQTYNPPNMLPTQQLKQTVYGQVNSS